MTKSCEKKIKPRKKPKKKPKEELSEKIEFTPNESEETYDIISELEQNIYFEYQNHGPTLMDFSRVQCIGMERQVFISFNLD